MEKEQTAAQKLRGLRSSAGSSEAQKLGLNTIPNFRTSELLSFQSAFTLAEILIVLTIIGIMAVMTIPSLIQNSNSQQKIAMFKKGFNAVYNAYATEFAIKSPPKTGSSENKEKLWDMLNNQLNVKYYVNASNGKKVYTLEEAKEIYIYQRVIVTEDKIGYRISNVGPATMKCIPKLQINARKKGSLDTEKYACNAITVILDNAYSQNKSCRVRWKIEVLFRNLKQLCHLEECQSKRTITQKHYVYACIQALMLLEKQNKRSLYEAKKYFQQKFIGIKCNGNRALRLLVA